MKTYPLFRVHVHTEQALANIKEVFASGFINEGTQVTQLTNELRAYLNADNLVLTNSCTSALTLALRLAGVQPGDEVISTPMTCVATNTPIVALGARIVWADVDPNHGMIDPQDVLRKITGRTKAVMAVAWAGTPPQLQELKEICTKHGVKLILDAAHAFDAAYFREPIHKWADFTCFPATTKITTQNGPRKISDVKIGDRVLTSSGEYKPVLAIMSRRYNGQWASLKAGQARISATIDHPIRVHRNGVDTWMKIGHVQMGDSVYVATKRCQNCDELIPFYTHVCKACYIDTNRSQAKSRKVSEAKRKHTRPTSRLYHHNVAVSPIMEKYRVEGYRVIPLIHAIPDFLAIKDGQIVAVEVESGSNVHLSKREKYDKLEADTYDRVDWHTLQQVKPWSGRHKYDIVGAFARVPVRSIRSGYTHRHNECTVYNLTLDQADPTYVAGGILVHNCYSFQAIKHFTTGDGGALVCLTDADHARAKALKWFGLDRDHAKDDKGNWKGQQWDVDIQEAGFKFNMNNVSAAIGLSQMKHIDRIVSLHIVNAYLYDDLFEGCTTVVPAARPAGADSSFWVYTMKVDPKRSRLQRDDLLKALNAEGIMAGVVHVPNDDYTAFQAFRSDLPGLREFAANQFSLPCGWWLDEDDVRHIAARVKELTR